MFLSKPWIVTISGWAARGLNVASRLLFVIWLLNYLGQEQYAIFAVVFSLEGWFLLSDFGVGSSAQNAMSAARGLNQDSLLLRQSIAQLCLLCALTSLGIILLISPLLNTFLFERLHSSRETFQALCVGGISYCLLAIGSVAYRILYAQQRGYLVHLMQMVATSLSLLSTWLLIHFYAGEHQLVYACFSTIGLQAAVALSTFFCVFRLKFLLHSWDWQEIRKLLSPAWRFFAFGLSAIAVLGIDYMVLARHVNAEQIIVYHVLSRMFMGFFVMHGALMQAMWPVSSEMVARGDLFSVRVLIKRCCLYGVIFVTVVTVGIAGFSSSFCHLFFSAQTLELPMTAIALFGGYYLIRALCDPYAMALQSVGHLTPLLLTVPVQAAVSLACQLCFVQIFGWKGIILGLICSYLFTVSWILPRSFYQWLTKRSYEFSQS